jgi:hypothetical protein
MKPLLQPERPDILPLGSAPKHMRKWLRDVGGVTPWNENRYRLVLAECVMLYCGARWHDWSPEASFEDMGGLEFSELHTRKSKYVMRDPIDPTKQVLVEADIPATVKVKDAKPVRVVEEMRWIQRYPKEKGWMLQVWYPSTYYSHEHYEVTVTGRPDLPLLGEFPNHGQYERQFFYLDDRGEKQETFPTMPGQSWMERAIQYHEHQLAKKADESPNVEWRMLTTLQGIKKARDHYQQEQREAFESEIKDRISPIFSNSLAGGRFREQLAQRCRAQGIKLGHVGN